MPYEKYIIGLFIFTWICIIVYAAAKNLIAHHHQSKSTTYTIAIRGIFHEIEKLADPRLRDELDEKLDEIRKQHFPKKG